MQESARVQRVSWSWRFLPGKGLEALPPPSAPRAGALYVAPSSRWAAFSPSGRASPAFSDSPMTVHVPAPQVAHFTLQNGLEVVVIPDHRAPRRHPHDLAPQRRGRRSGRQVGHRLMTAMGWTGARTAQRAMMECCRKPVRGKPSGPSPSSSVVGIYASAGILA